MPIDKHITPTPEQLQALGIQNASGALKNLQLLQHALGEEWLSELLPNVLSDLGRTADPDMALNNLERFVSVLSDVASFLECCRAHRDALLYLITIFGASRFLSTFLVTMGDATLSLVSVPGYLTHAPGKAGLSERFKGINRDSPDEKAFYRNLRIFRKQEMLRIALRDLLNKADLQEIVGDLSDLAAVCLQQACARVDAELQKRYGRPLIQSTDGAEPAGFAVIAMGKLGGWELNFSSDVDLMYVYTADGETEGVVAADGVVMNRVTNHQYFIKLAEKLSAAINDKTEDGFVFRVDLRLRPEGRRGPLAQSLGGYEIYYESWGQTWERSALIKARPVAGDEAVGEEFLARIKPFVYRKYLDYNAITEIREMKEKINEDVRQKGKTHRDVKLGYGGIREIEFVIQALQLIYGGRDRALRRKNALKALHMLSQKGLLTYEEHAILSKAYAFLRTVEHRLQMLDDLQTQTLPSDEGELRTLARRAGYFEQGREAESLIRDYGQHTRKVRAIYNNLFAFTGEEESTDAASREYDLLLDPETPDQDAVALLAKSGFRDPNKARRDLLLLREGPAFVHQTPRSRRFFDDIFPSLFREIVASHDPDMALNHLESFLASEGSWETFQSLVRLDTSAINVLIAVFANSEYLSRMLVGRPVLLQNLLETRRVSGSGTMVAFTRELNEALDKAGDLTEKLDVLRRFKHQEEIRIGMADLLTGMRIETVSRELSKLAEVCLNAALRISAQEAGKRYGVDGSLAGLAIIGAGKLGGRELSYGSDLDILFVFSESHAVSPPTGLSIFEYFSKIAEKTIAYLSTLTREGFVFRVDTRLRPTGSKGPLVQSIDAFKIYYASQAETWERQALLRTRCVAGDGVVGTVFMEALQDLVYQNVDEAALARDVLAMRMRMEEELGKEGARRYNIKQGTGGLVDIEFLVQFLQLLHGKRHPWVRVPGTHNALRALRKEQFLDEQSYRVLLRSYLFLRQLESRIRIITNQATTELSRDPEALHPLARRMGYTDEGTSAGQKLLADYELIVKQVRGIFEERLRRL
jgi:glutamate-ammonia-ligase adenylyltransferase